LGVSLSEGLIDFLQLFGREAPRILEIGFGSGRSLIEMARCYPEYDFVGIEMHRPGIGAILSEIAAQNMSNIRICYADAVHVLEHCIPNDSLDAVQIFFPDPWQKRKHHKRRLIQPMFVKLVVSKLRQHGTLHVATDWEDYAKHMAYVLSAATELINLVEAPCFASCFMKRSVVTKFEARGVCSGRNIWDLQFIKK
jgi:tRNA (guanine-N7-)-methyltransferase